MFNQAERARRPRFLNHPASEIALTVITASCQPATVVLGALTEDGARRDSPETTSEPGVHMFSLGDPRRTDTLPAGEQVVIVCPVPAASSTLLPSSWRKRITMFRHRSRMVTTAGDVAAAAESCRLLVMSDGRGRSRRERLEFTEELARAITYHAEINGGRVESMSAIMIDGASVSVDRGLDLLSRWCRRHVEQITNAAAAGTPARPDQTVHRRAR